MNRRVLMGVAVLALLGAGTAVAVLSRPDPLDKAGRTLESDARFETILDSITALRQVSDDLYIAGRECANRGQDGHGVCTEMLSTAAVAQVAAANGASCSAAILHDARRSLQQRVAELTDALAQDRAPTDEGDVLPPRC